MQERLKEMYRSEHEKLDQEIAATKVLIDKLRVEKSNAEVKETRKENS